MFVKQNKKKDKMFCYLKNGSNKAMAVQNY